MNRYFRFKPWGWDQTFTVLTGIGAIIGLYIAYNSEFFKVATQIAELQRLQLVDENKKIKSENVALADERQKLTEDNNRLKDEIQGTKEEWDAIDKVSGPTTDFDLSGGFRSNITYYRPSGGFVFYYADPSNDFTQKPKASAELDKYVLLLGQIKRLKKVIIYNYLVNSSAMTEIGSCRNIVGLDLINCDINNQTLRNLDTLPNLEILELSRNQIDNLDGIKKQSSVKLLILNDCPIGDDQVKYILENFPNVDLLDLSKTKISDDACRQLIALDKLSFLDLAHSNIRKPGLEILATTSKKLVVRITEEMATPKELEELRQKAKPNFSISSPGFEWKAE